MAQISCTLLLILGAWIATTLGRAQDGKGANHALQPATLEPITDPTEYAAYMATINTTSPESRLAALSAFLKRFPNSVMRDEVEDSLMETMVQLDNERTAQARTELRLKRIQSAAPCQKPCRAPRPQLLRSMPPGPVRDARSSRGR